VDPERHSLILAQKQGGFKTASGRTP
jgi:hypothetical protein